MAIPGRDPVHTARSLYLAKSVLKSSVVLQAVHGHIRSPSTLDVVFGKETALELVVLSEDGVVQSICEQSVFGTIKDLRVLPWNELYRDPKSQASGKDLLVLLSDSGKLSFLTFSIDLHRFEALSQRGLPQSNVPRRDLGRCLAVHPWGRAVAVGAFEDRLAIFPASQLAGNDIVEQMIVFPRESFSPFTSIEPTISRDRHIVVGWGTIWSMEFVCLEDEKLISEGSDLVLAVLLHRKGARDLELQILLCDTGNRCIMVVSRFQPSGGIAPDLMAYSIIGVPAFPGLLIILRSGDLVVVDIRCLKSVQIISVVKLISCESNEGVQNGSADLRTRIGDEETICNVAASALLLLTRDMNGNFSHPALDREECPGALLERQSVSVEQPLVIAWSWEPGEFRSRLVLGMDTGKIHIVEFFRDATSNMQVDIHLCQYECASCNILLWTKGGFLLAFVHMGDGQVLRIGNHGLTCESIIQDIAPILDFTLVDVHGEKQDQMFACSGAGSEGSVRIIRNAISVGKLLSTPPIHAGVTGIWTMRIQRADPNHAFLVISFVGETRVLSVGLSFVDITDDVGFEPFGRTLSCGRIENGWVVQICSKEVRACAPTSAAHARGVISDLPYVAFWRPPPNLFVSLGAVSQGKVILSLSQPGLVLMLGTSMAVNGMLQLVGVQQCLLEAEISSISIPQEEELAPSPLPPSIVGIVDGTSEGTFWRGVEVGKICVVGTHKPSVELLSIVPGEGFRQLALGTVALQNANGTALGGCVPESVRLSCFDHPYILAGLRNGMILRYEWPDGKVCSFADSKMNARCSRSAADAGDFQVESRGRVDNVQKLDEAVQLHLVAVRRIGVSPVLLIPLEASLRSDILALSDRPWLLQTARHSRRIAYTTISFEPSTCATPVSMPDCPNGIFFVADCSLHLVEMERGKRLNVQRLLSGKTPHRVAYHSSSNTLLVIRTELCKKFSAEGSDICCVDPMSGRLHSSYNLLPGETAKSLVIWKLGDEELIVVGTNCPAILPSGESESGRGRLLIFRLQPKVVNTNFPGTAASTDEEMISDLWTGSEERGHDGQMLSDSEGWDFSLKNHHVLPGIVLALSPYMGHYLLVSAGNAFCCLGYRQDGSQRLRRLAVARTRFMITSISVHLTRIAICDCRDGVLLYSFREELCKFELLYCDPVQRLVSGCALVDEETAVATDWHGNFCCLTSSHIPEGMEEYHNPERNLAVSSWYHVGEAVTSISKGSFSYRDPVEVRPKLYAGGSSSSSKKKNSLSSFGDCSVVACSVLGSVIIFTPLESEEYNLLKEVQLRLAIFPLTAPLLGNNHSQFRRKGSPAGAYDVLDGDMIWQFLELTSAQQQAVLTLHPNLLTRFGRDDFLPSLPRVNLSIDQVLRVLERVHNAVT